MHNYKITVQYDGTRYRGWQSQENTEQTIQGKLNSIFSRMEGREAEVQGSGRTDSGVHAVGQVANFKIVNTEKRSAPEIMAYGNEYLPDDIGIIQIEEVSMDFHSRFSAKEKTYVYRIWNSKTPNVLARQFVSVIEEPLNIPAMREAAKQFIGTHDFKAFCATNKGNKSTQRTISQCQVEAIGDEVRFTISGSGFLYHMIRIMVGTLVEIGLSTRKIDDINRILLSKSREEAGMTMEAKGLTLMEVKY